MNYKVSFQELAIIQQRVLSKQQPTTLEKAKKQVETLKKFEFTKKQEAKKLIEWIEIENRWFQNHYESSFIASGVEQRIYLHSIIQSFRI